MKNFRESFEQTYGFDAIEFIREIGNEYFGILKSIGINSAIDSYAEKKGYKIPNNRSEVEQYNKFQIALLEAMQQEQVKFPENQKIVIDQSSRLEITPINPNIPKSKGVLEDFKNIVGSDVFRPSMNGVFVDEDVLVATDAHKMVIYENSDFKKYKGQIIDLGTYLGTKGDKVVFIDAKYPDYQVVLPKTYEKRVNNVSLYALYNFAQSCIFMKKLQDNDVFNCNISLPKDIISLNPILLSETTAFLLAKGMTKCDVEYDTPNTAIVLKSDSKNLGLLMPIFVSNLNELTGTIVYKIEEIQVDFNSQKTSGNKVAKITKKVSAKKTTKQLEYTKFTGKIADTVYIPRRDIVSILLKNGEEIAGNEIVDGVYKMK